MGQISGKWGRQAGEVMWGALQLYTELGCRDWLSLLLFFQLPLPLIELMETEVLDILRKALNSEFPLPQLPQKILVALAGLGTVEFQDMYAFSDPLSTHTYSKDALKIKSQETRHRQTQWSDSEDLK